jgi:hypothetical protein
MLKTTLAAAALLALAATPAFAKCEQGTADAKALAFDATTPDSAADFSAVVSVGAQGLGMLTNGVGFKPDEPACAIGVFSIGTLQYMVYGDDGSTFARRAHGNGAEAYLLITVTPHDAHAFMRALQKVSHDAALMTLSGVRARDIVYMLATHQGGSWTVYGFYDKIPDTPRLAQAMCQAVLGSLPPIATYRESDQSVALKMIDQQAALDFVGRNGGACTVGPAPQ